VLCSTKNLGSWRMAEGLSLQECLAVTLLCQAAASVIPPQGMAWLCWVCATGVAEVTEPKWPCQVTSAHNIWSSLGSSRPSSCFPKQQYVLWMVDARLRYQETLICQAIIGKLLESSLKQLVAWRSALLPCALPVAACMSQAALLLHLW